jgi:hypothetical protein
MESPDRSAAKTGSASHPPSPAPCGMGGRIVLYLVLYILCSLTYHGMSDNYLFNDDFSWISEARYTMEWGNILSTRVIGFFRPAVNASFFLIERAAPGNFPLQYRINLLLHIICSIIVFHLVLSLGCGGVAAALASALFAVTSVHTGAVLWISARTTLLSTALLLSSITLLVRTKRAGAAAHVFAVILYTLSLAAKETAVAGLPLLLLLWLLYRNRLRLGPGLASFAAVTSLYLILRAFVMGGFVQDNWGPGPHVLRNVGGGFLYQLYPWPLFSLFHPRWAQIHESTHPFVPEILAIPVLLLLLWAGSRTGKFRCAAAGSGWALISLGPASLFTYRFFSTASITQNRYYYLSSLGTALLIAIFVGAVWDSRRRWARIGAAAIVVLLVSGYMVRAHRLERKMDEFTRMYREIITTIVEASDEFPAISTLAVLDPPMAFQYLRGGVALERPDLEVVEVTGGREEALDHSPCLYVTYSGTFPKVMRMEMLD